MEVKDYFGGRETPLNADITYCEKYKECSFYKKGKCFSAGRIGPNCKFGKKQNVQGYTSRAIKYGEFRRKYREDECFAKLGEPNNKVGKIKDMFVINMKYLHEKEGGGYEIETNIFFRASTVVDAFYFGGKTMGRKSRYTEYAKGMNKGTAAKNATTTKSKSIKNKLQELKEKSKKGDK